MELLLIGIAAFGAAVLTFFSGFGLGTILTPVFLLFFPADVAVGLVGTVHFLNNLYKVLLVGKAADWRVVLRFGLPAILAAFLGAGFLLSLPDGASWMSYTLLGKTFEITITKSMLAVLLLGFAIIDLSPRLSSIRFGEDKLAIGGLLSGFFGGLSGNQGALRSAFLIKSGLSKEAYIGTAVICSTLVDMSRMAMYTTRLHQLDWHSVWPTVFCATLSAIAGATLGNRLLKKVTITSIQRLVGILLIGLAIALGLGFL